VKRLAARWGQATTFRAWDPSRFIDRCGVPPPTTATSSTCHLVLLPSFDASSAERGVHRRGSVCRGRGSFVLIILSYRPILVLYPIIHPIDSITALWSLLPIHTAVLSHRIALPYRCGDAMECRDRQLTVLCPRRTVPCCTVLLYSPNRRVWFGVGGANEASGLCRRVVCLLLSRHAVCPAAPSVLSSTGFGRSKTDVLLAMQSVVLLRLLFEHVCPRFSSPIVLVLSIEVNKALPRDG